MTQYKEIEAIEKEVLDDLALWLKDSFAKCETVEMRKSTATAIVMRALMYCFLSGLAKKGSSKEDVLQVVGSNWDIIAELYKPERIAQMLGEKNGNHH